jgi:glycolate oxidase FAD binding subunit
VTGAEQVLPLTEIITPAEQEAVADVVRNARQSATPVYPIGGATSLDYGATPYAPGLGLSLTGLRRVVDYPARDLTITVEAGVTFAELAGRLAEERQWVPVDVPQAERATVGGVVATGPVGPRRFRYGSLRDYVIGVRAVDGRGTPFSGGGRVVKNAAGYDLCRLLTGSLGTLGVITQVTLMVKPMPQTSALVACDVPGFDAAERLVAGLIHTKTLPAAVELLTGPAWDEGDELPAASEAAVARLVVGFEGSSADVDWMVERLKEEWRGGTHTAPTVICGDRCAPLWRRLAEFPASAPETGGTNPAVVQISTLPSAAVDLVSLVLQVDPGCSIQCHAGDGILRARLSLEPDRVAAALRERLRPAVAETGGSVVVLRSPDGAGWTRDVVWGPPGPGGAVMQSIKDQFDPGGILNPDRYSYGNP